MIKAFVVVLIVLILSIPGCVAFSNDVELPLSDDEKFEQILEIIRNYQIYVSTELRVDPKYWNISR